MLEKFLSKTKFDSYEDFMQNFKVNVPENFNFGYDVVDEWARTNPDKPALLWTFKTGRPIRSRMGTPTQKTPITSSWVSIE